MKGLIFTDLDGTLLNSQRQVSLANRQLIEELRQKDIWTIPTTGRSYNVGRSVLEGLYLPYYIGFNGCLITDHKGHILFDEALPIYLLKEIIEFCNGHDIGITGYQGEDIYYNLDKPETLAYLKRTGLKNIRQFSHPSFKGHDCYKMLISEPVEKVKYIYDLFNGYFSNGLFHLSESGGGRLEIYSAKSHKGIAAGWLCDYLQYDIAKAIAIGDADNDVELLKSCGLSIAMGDSSAAIKKIAMYETDTNENEGWYKAIKKYA